MEESSSYTCEQCATHRDRKDATFKRREAIAHVVEVHPNRLIAAMTKKFGHGQVLFAALLYNVNALVDTDEEMRTFFVNDF